MSTQFLDPRGPDRSITEDERRELYAKMSEDRDEAAKAVEGMVFLQSPEDDYRHSEAETPPAVKQQAIIHAVSEVQSQRRESALEQFDRTDTNVDELLEQYHAPKLQSEVQADRQDYLSRQGVEGGQAKAQPVSQSKAEQQKAEQAKSEQQKSQAAKSEAKK